MSTDATPRLALDYVVANQAQKHVTVNGDLWRLDALVQMRLESRGVSAPPEEPALGACWLMPPGGGTGAWAAFAEGVIVRDDLGIWTPVDAPVGALAYVADEGEAVLLTHNGWRALGLTLSAVGPLSRLGVGAEPDAETPLVVAGAGSLFDAGADGDHRLAVNRQTPDDTASVVFQTAYSGQAEIGLCGVEGLAVRASDDGSVWRTVLAVDPSGRLGVNRTAPEAVVHVATEVTADPVLMLSAHSDTDVGCNITGRKTRGSVAAPTAVRTGDRLLAFYARGWTSSGAGGNTAAVQILAAEDFTAGAQGSSITFETTPLGAAARRPVVAYQPNGAMRLIPLAGAPAAPQPGEVYFDQTLNTFRGWTGSTWTTLGAG